MTPKRVAEWVDYIEDAMGIELNVLDRRSLKNNVDRIQKEVIESILADLEIATADIRKKAK